MSMKNHLTLFMIAGLLLMGGIASAQNNPGSNHGNKFEQLSTMLPTPNTFRSPDGTPGPDYWQQRADYDIECTLDAENLKLEGTELITYYNQSPNTLRYLWLQLDENEHKADADNRKFDPSSIRNTMSEGQLQNLETWRYLDKYGHNITAVTDANGTPLHYTINKTMMRVDLPTPLKSGETYSFRVNWFYNISDRNGVADGRGGYEYFEEDENYLFTITQWFPRMCVYSDVEGWQNKQFTGRGEFALTFGNYLVKMTVPDDHIVGSTGECLNYSTVLDEEQLERWQKAKTASEPVEIVTLKEAKKQEKRKKSKGTKTWIYKAENVRDFAWTSSRKFVWDAMPHITSEGKRVMCMSYYPKESYPIYSKYSTKVVAHTLKTYSKYTGLPYPYPVAISVEASNGMEYPMICFNYGRADEDGTYTERAKYGAISVIIHEVGHNYFPMIINSDERQWTWMDEGINTFVQFLSEQEFDNNYPSRRGMASGITGYMKLPKNQLEPIMTNSENIVRFGSNAYAKPATALNILRETVMGRELFDFAFKSYCQRWAFKHPSPADFFRSMEDASAVDLDWFWRGWFYTTEAVDISLDSIEYYRVDLESGPEPREYTNTYKHEKPEEHLSQKRNKEAGMEFAIEQDPNLVDFYTNYKPWETEDSVQTYTRELYAETFTKEEREDLYGNQHFYQLHFSNKGGLVMPVILEWTFEDGTTQVDRIPAEIWRKNEDRFTKVFVKDKKVTAVRLDPFKETADIDESNNNWPVKEVPSRFQVFKRHKFQDQANPMQKAMGKEIKP